MKKIIFLFLLLPVAASAQNNFNISNAKILWEKEFNSRQSLKQLYIGFKKANVFESIDTLDGELIATIKQFAPDVKGAGYGYMNVPILFTWNYIEAFVIVKTKDTMIQVLIKDIILILKESNGLLGKKGDKNKLEEIALKKDGTPVSGGKKFDAWGKTTIILNRDFENLLSFIK